MWSNIKQICNIESKQTNKSDELLYTSDTPLDSVNAANSYFADVGATLAENIINSLSGNPINPIDDTHTHAPSSLALYLATEPEVIGAINSLKNRKAPGWDGISSEFYKTAKYILCSPITHICNLCILSGVFPRILKKSIICPIFKGGDRNRICNYRPISLLPVMAKILEKIINKRLVNYIENKCLLSNNQFGFRPKKSTVDAVISITTTLVNLLDSGKKCVGVFLDFAKAFDTVSVPHLLQKLDNLGIRGIPHQLFQSYLTDRVQSVKVGDYQSDEIPVTYGVPQGSILGPTLFTIYINELCDMKLTNTLITTYADDTALIFSGDTWTEVKQLTETGLHEISTWLQSNILTLNVVKTKYIPFSISERSSPAADFEIKIHSCVNHNSMTHSTCSCPSLMPTDNIKYLGIYLDKHLKWSKHITEQSSRIRKLIYIFKNLRHVADNELVKRVYVALVQSLVNYCLPVWGGATKTNLMKMERAQRCLLKVMSFKPYRHPTKQLYQETNLLTVRQLYILHAVLYQHSKLDYETTKLKKSNKRRKDIVCNLPLNKNKFTNNQLPFLSAYLYNLVNRILDIFNMNRHQLKRAVQTWIAALDYDETEGLLVVQS